jgi:hypothetical protein
VPERETFPIRDRYTVAGLVVGDVCFECRCRVLELAGEHGMVLAWCECELPQDAALMEVF